MKYLIRYFSVFLSLVLLLGVSSITANAEDNTLSNYKVFIAIGTPDFNNGMFTTVDPFNDELEKSEFADQYYLASGDTVNLTYNYTINTDVSPIIKKGNEVELSFFDVYYSVGVKSTYDNSFIYEYTPTSIRLLVTYTDNTQQYFNSTFTTKNKLLNITNTFTPQKDVKGLEYIVADTISAGNRAKNLTFYLGEFGNSSNQFSITYTQETEETGLLKGIIEWLKGIKQGITDLFNSIAELPSKIWSFIENGLKTLFIPDEDTLSYIGNMFLDLLNDKLGAVAQVVELALLSWDKLEYYDAINSIDFPLVNLKFGNVNFSFGGYSVPIVPQGFEFIADTLKTITGIIATYLFINGLRHRYDEIMGVEK